MKSLNLFVLISIFFVISCKDKKTFPKPTSYLRIDFPEKNYRLHFVHSIASPNLAWADSSQMCRVGVLNNDDSGFAWTKQQTPEGKTDSGNTQSHLLQPGVFPKCSEMSTYFPKF